MLNLFSLFCIYYQLIEDNWIRQMYYIYTWLLKSICPREMDLSVARSMDREPREIHFMSMSRDHQAKSTLLTEKHIYI